MKLLAVAALAVHAHGYAFAPDTTTTAMQGKLQVSGQSCHVTFEFKVNAHGIGKVVSASADHPRECPVTFKSLPWATTPTGALTAQAAGVDWYGEDGSCGPTTLSIQLYKQYPWDWTFHNAHHVDGCGLQGTLISIGHSITIVR